jgi:hypothetical protein
VFLRSLSVVGIFNKANYLINIWVVDLDFSRLPGEGRLPASGVPAGRLPPAGAGLPAAGLPAAGLPAAGLPAAVRAAASTAAAEQRAFLHGRMVCSSSSPFPALMCRSWKFPRRIRSKVVGANRPDPSGAGGRRAGACALWRGWGLDSTREPPLEKGAAAHVGRLALPWRRVGCYTQGILGRPI